VVLSSLGFESTNWPDGIPRPHSYDGLRNSREISEVFSKPVVSPFRITQELSHQCLFSLPTDFGSGHKTDDKRLMKRTEDFESSARLPTITHQRRVFCHRIELTTLHLYKKCLLYEEMILSSALICIVGFSSFWYVALSSAIFCKNSCCVMTPFSIRSFARASPCARVDTKSSSTVTGFVVFCHFVCSSYAVVFSKVPYLRASLSNHASLTPACTNLL